MSGEATQTTQEMQTAEGWLRLSPLVIWPTVFALGLFFVLPALIVVPIILVAGGPWWVAVIVVLGAILLSGAITGVEVLRYRHTWYRVTEERAEMRSGVLSRTHLSLARERIRAVDLERPLWHRPFGLCRVTVGTGQSAGSGEELKLDPVTRDEGERLRRELLFRAARAQPGRAEQAAEAADTEGGEQTHEPEPVELAAMQPRWFAYGMGSLASAGVGYGILAAAAGALGDNIPTLLPRLLPGVADTLATVLAQYLLLTILAALVGAVVIGSLLSFAIYVEAWWGYRLTREPDGTLRVRRGLLNVSSVSIEERRLRGIRFMEYLPLRWVGAASVAAVASGLGSAKNQKNQGVIPKSYLSPEMPRAEALRVAGEVLPGAEPPPLTAHPRAALGRRRFRALVVVAVLAAAGAGLGWGVEPVSPWWALAPAAVALPLGLLYAQGAYRGLGHGLGEPKPGRHYLLLRRGMFLRSTSVLKREAVIGWRVRRSPFQRRRGLSTLGATVAADKGVHWAPDIGTGDGLRLAEEAVPDLLTPFLERKQVS
jgi:putative membrane protein